MGKLAAQKKGVKQMVSLGAVNPAAEELLADLDTRVEAIQLLIPLGLQAVAEELDRAVVECVDEPADLRIDADHVARTAGTTVPWLAAIVAVRSQPVLVEELRA